MAGMADEEKLLGIFLRKELYQHCATIKESGNKGTQASSHLFDLHGERRSIEKQRKKNIIHCLGHAHVPIR